MKLQEFPYLFAKALTKARTNLHKTFGYPVIRNFGARNLPKRALLVYIVDPFLLNRNDKSFLFHQHLKQSLQIAAVLNKTGYSVDVMDYRSKDLHLETPYDLIISHKPDLHLPREIGISARKIYLATGMNHASHKIFLNERAEYLYERRGARIDQLDFPAEHMPYVSDCDSIFAFGNEVVADTWKHQFNKPVYSFNNYGFDSTRFVQRNYDLAKKKFLFFGSNQLLGKGLDLLLESFTQLPELELIVCASFAIEKDFPNIFTKELFHTPNIHTQGWVNMNSDQFYALVSHCGFTILPTCSEGSPGSITASMRTGLIPVVTRNASISIEGFGYLIREICVSSLVGLIRTLAETDSNELQHRSELTRAMSDRCFSEAAFTARWENMLSEFLGNHQAV